MGLVVLNSTIGCADDEWNSTLGFSSRRWDTVIFERTPGTSSRITNVEDADSTRVAADSSTLRAGWYRAFACTLALALISAAASIAVVFSISRSLQSAATTVDQKSTMTIDLRRSLIDEVSKLHLIIDVGSPAAVPFLAADAQTQALFERARGIYTTADELTLLGLVERDWNQLIGPYRPIAADPTAADEMSSRAGLDPQAKSLQHLQIVNAEQQYQEVVDTLHTVSRQTMRNELAAVENLEWLFLAMLVLLFTASLAASVYFARKMSRLVGAKTDELRYQALHDTLTGLPNRALITDRIEQLLARNRRHGTSGAALFVDLDGFKNVNDSAGHDAGDRLLRAVAARLVTAVRDADTIGRMGGDEFVVLVDGGITHTAPELVAQRLLDVMVQPFVLEGIALPLVVTTSVGIAVGDRPVADDLLRDADVALYQAKRAGKNCFATFSADMQRVAHHRNTLEFDLRSALEAGQFRLVYQPIYSLQELDVVGVEALIRWEHPTFGIVQPDDFIPLLEASGHIIEVGRWVLQEACNQMAAWRDRGSDLTVSVNVSGRQFDRDSIVDHVREALETSGLDPGHLTLEVTEAVLMRNVEATRARLLQLKDLGVQVAIDDFGTGYSSLASLQRLPVDCLKIDRAFTDAIRRGPESEIIIHTLVQLGKSLGLRTLAEGVETTDQVDYLRDQSVNEAQGFLLARPLDAATLQTQILDPLKVLAADAPPTA